MTTRPPGTSTGPEREPEVGSSSGPLTTHMCPEVCLSQTWRPGAARSSASRSGWPPILFSSYPAPTIHSPSGAACAARAATASYSASSVGTRRSTSASDRPYHAMWLWASWKPGVTTAPPRSIVRCAGTSSRATIRSRQIATAEATSSRPALEGPDPGVGEQQVGLHALPLSAAAFSTRCDAVSGRSSRNSQKRGTLNAASRSAHQAAQLVGGGAGRHDVRLDLLAADLVGDADDGREPDRGVREQHVLDLAGGDVLAAAPDHVLEPPVR